MIDIKYRPVSYDPKAALDVLLEARRKAGLTQEDVAARMGVSQPALARVEADK
jgi:predicted transcriptional regulator